MEINTDFINLKLFIKANYGNILGDEIILREKESFKNGIPLENIKIYLINETNSIYIEAKERHTHKSYSWKGYLPVDIAKEKGIYPKDDTDMIIKYRPWPFAKKIDIIKPDVTYALNKTTEFKRILSNFTIVLNYD